MFSISERTRTAEIHKRKSPTLRQNVIPSPHIPRAFDSKNVLPASRHFDSREAKPDRWRWSRDRLSVSPSFLLAVDLSTSLSTWTLLHTSH